MNHEGRRCALPGCDAEIEIMPGRPERRYCAAAHRAAARQARRVELRVRRVEDEPPARPDGFAPTGPARGRRCGAEPGRRPPVTPPGPGPLVGRHAAPACAPRLPSQDTDPHRHRAHEADDDEIERRNAASAPDVRPVRSPARLPVPADRSAELDVPDGGADAYLAFSRSLVGASCGR